MVYTYVLKSKKDNTFYTGISANPGKRIIIHNKGDVYSTKNKRPWLLVYKKMHNDYNEARRHEKWLKKKNKEYKNKLAG